MPIDSKTDINRLRDFSSIFMRNEINSWLNGDLSSLESKIKRYSKIIPKSERSTYLQFVKHAYCVVEKNYQNEYVYKNLFLSEFLNEEIITKKSIVFNEFRVGNSVADLVVFNGKSKAFEIKTEFDSDARLIKQIQEYKKAFNEVYIIVPKNKISYYEKYSSDVGIITFDFNNREKFELYEKSKFEEDLDYKTMFDILHTKEYKEIVNEYFGELPSINIFNQYNVCYDLIQRIPKKKLNELFIEKIKKRKQDFILSTRVYREFNQICLALKLRKAEKAILIEKLKVPVNL